MKQQDVSQDDVVFFNRTHGFLRTREMPQKPKVGAHKNAPTEILVQACCKARPCAMNEENATMAASAAGLLLGSTGKRS